MRARATLQLGFDVVVELSDHDLRHEKYDITISIPASVDELALSPLTAKTHVARLSSKLDARDRAQLVIIAYETGLVVPGER
jgi:hypothetical protein